MKIDLLKKVMVAIVAVPLMYCTTAVSVQAAWEVEVIEAEEAFAIANSLVMDEAGFPHVAYIAESAEEGSRILRYATRRSCFWQYENVAVLENTKDEQVIIDVGPDGRPRISVGYSFSINGSTGKTQAYAISRFSRKGESDWRGDGIPFIEVRRPCRRMADGRDEIEYRYHFAIDPDGNPHILCHSTWYNEGKDRITVGEDDLVYLRPDVSGYARVDLEVTQDKIIGNISNDTRSIVVGPRMKAHIVYSLASKSIPKGQDYPTRQLIYAVSDGSSRVYKETVVPLVDWQENSIPQAIASIALDSHGSPHICYQSHNYSFGEDPYHWRTELMYAWRLSRQYGWEKAIVDSEWDYYTGFDLSVDDLGDIHLLYGKENGRPSETEVGYTTQVLNNWEGWNFFQERVESTGNVSYGFSTAVDSNEVPYAIYYEDDEGLNFAYPAGTFNPLLPQWWLPEPSIEINPIDLYWQQGVTILPDGLGPFPKPSI